MDHVIESLATLFSPESKPDADDMRVVRAMQKNGPYWFNGQYPTVGVAEELKHPRGGDYVRVKAARTDGSGNPTGQVDYHYYVGELRLYFRSEKQLDTFWEAFADARLAVINQACCESPKDYAVRVTNLYRSRAIRVVLNVICIDHGATLKDLEDRRVIYCVSGRM